MIPLHKIGKEVVVSDRLLHFIRTWQGSYPNTRPLRIMGKRVEYYNYGGWIRLGDGAITNWITFYPERVETNFINWHLVTVRAERIYS